MGITRLLIPVSIIGIIIFIPYFFLAYWVDALLRTIAFTSLAALLLIANYHFRQHKTSKYFSYLCTILMFASLSVSILELGYFYITGSSFKVDVLFWDKINLQFIIDALNANKTLSSVAAIYLIGTTAIFHKLNMIFLKSPCPFIDKIKKIEKTLLIIYLIHVSIITSAFVNLHASRELYTAMNNDSLEFIQDQPYKTDIWVKKTDNKQKNVVHIILESFSQDYISPDLTPNLYSLKSKGVLLNNMIPYYREQFSMAGHLMAKKGELYIQSNKIDKDKSVSYDYITKQAGYNNVFIRGAKKNCFGNFSGIYSEENGTDLFIAQEELKHIYDRKHESRMGFSDEVVFEEAFKQYEDLNKKEKPFTLTIFNIDSHGDPQKTSIACNDKIEYQSSNKMIKGIQCSDYILGNFLDKISKTPSYKDTLIVIHSDHLPHKKGLKNNDSKLFGLILNSDAKPFVQDKDTFIHDMPRTIIDNIGIETNAVFPLGENILEEDFNREVKTISGVENKVYIGEDSLSNNTSNIIEFTKYLYRKSGNLFN